MHVKLWLQQLATFAFHYGISWVTWYKRVQVKQSTTTLPVMAIILHLTSDIPKTDVKERSLQEVMQHRIVSFSCSNHHHASFGSRLTHRRSNLRDMLPGMQPQKPSSCQGQKQPTCGWNNIERCPSPTTSGRRMLEAVYLACMTTVCFFLPVICQQDAGADQGVLNNSMTVII